MSVWRVQGSLRSARGVAGSACRSSCGAITPTFPTTKNLEALIYGRQIRVLFGGSQCVQAQPAHRFPGIPGKPETLAAPIYGGQWSSLEPAAATGCRLSLPTGSRWPPALPAVALVGAITPSFPTTKNPEAPIYGRRIRLAGASSCVQAQPARMSSAFL